MALAWVTSAAPEAVVLAGTAVGGLVAARAAVAAAPAMQLIRFMAMDDRVERSLALCPDRP